MSTSGQIDRQTGIGAMAQRWSNFVGTYLWIFVERTVSTSLKLHFIKAKGIEDAIDVVEMASLGANECE